MSIQWWPSTWSCPLLSWRRIASSRLLPQHDIEEEASCCCPQGCQSIHQVALCVQSQTSQQHCQVLPNEEIQIDGELSCQSQECQNSGDQLHGAGRCWAGEELQIQYCYLNIKLKKKPATAARKCVNPFTKEPCVCKSKPASKIVKCFPMKKFKEMVNWVVHPAMKKAINTKAMKAMKTWKMAQWSWSPKRLKTSCWVEHFYHCETISIFCYLLLCSPHLSTQKISAINIFFLCHTFWLWFFQNMIVGVSHVVAGLGNKINDQKKKCIFLSLFYCKSHML